MDTILGGKKLKDFWRGDAVLHDNFLFKFHHQGNFAVILFGVVFIFGMNYLDGKAIQCTHHDNKDFNEKYCWLHGSGHVPDNLQPSGGSKCIANQNDISGKDDERHTRYYLWVPFVLVLCLAVIKAPRVLWKQVFERRQIAGAVGGPDGQPSDKIAQRFEKLRKKAHRLHWGFFLCELFNIASVFLCFAILNALFGKKFYNYGSDFLRPQSTGVDPLCNIFPTVVSCNVKSGGADGNVDNASLLCLLSNNLFNQYYFLIVWFWWVALLSASGLGLVYRLAEILLPPVSRLVFLCRLEPHGVDLSDFGPATWRQLRPADLFLLGRICQNLKGSQITELLKELEKAGSSRTKAGLEPEGNMENVAMLTVTTKA